MDREAALRHLVAILKTDKDGAFQWPAEQIEQILDWTPSPYPEAPVRTPSDSITMPDGTVIDIIPGKHVRAWFEDDCLHYEIVFRKGEAK
jgi:hypothetical protein